MIVGLIYKIFYWSFGMFRWINWYLTFELHVSGFPLNSRARCRSKWTSSPTCTAIWKWSARPLQTKRQVSRPSFIKICILYLLKFVRTYIWIYGHKYIIIQINNCDIPKYLNINKNSKWLWNGTKMTQY